MLSLPQERPHPIYLQQVEERPLKLEAFKGDEKSHYGGWRQSEVSFEKVRKAHFEERNCQ